jgi:PAS domain S-box-containing protein
VVVSDIATDPLWADYCDLALAHGLRACWSTPILSSAGKVLGTFAIYYREPRSPTAQEHDLIKQISHFASIAVERRRAEEVLGEQASLLDLTHDSVFVRDMSDVVSYWNRGAEELYGWTAKEVLGKSTTHQMLRTVFPAPLAEIKAELLRTGRWEGDLLHTKRDGTQIVVASRWALQRDEHGRPVAILETNNDLTNRKQAEEALRRTQAELAHASRVSTLGELTASIAHEVNQPLAGLVSSGNACLRWLASEPPNIECARQSVDRIIRDANRASEVVGRVRGLAKKAPPEKVWLNINDTVLETLGLTRMEAAQNRASLRTQLSDTAPAVWADRVQVQQVILNLIINGIEAVGAVSDGKRDLFVSTAKHETDGVLVTVRDTGTGLDPGKLEHIFDAFYTTKREGMGMGLAVSRSIVEAHGGRLWATPNEPRGAVLQFVLPTGREEAL